MHINYISPRYHFRSVFIVHASSSFLQYTIRVLNQNNAEANSWMPNPFYALLPTNGLFAPHWNETGTATGTGNWTSTIGNDGSWFLSLSQTSVNISVQHIRTHYSGYHSIYPSMSEGNVFGHMCDSVHRERGQSTFDPSTQLSTRNHGPDPSPPPIMDLTYPAWYCPTLPPDLGPGLHSACPWTKNLIHLPEGANTSHGG